MTSEQIKAAKSDADRRLAKAKETYRIIDTRLRQEAAKLLVRAIGNHPSAHAARHVRLAPQQMREMEGRDGRMRYGVDVILETVAKLEKVDWTQTPPPRIRGGRGRKPPCR